MDTKSVILVCLPPERFGPAEREKMVPGALGREIIRATNPAEIEKFLDRVEIYMGIGSWDLLPQMPRLRWIQSWGAGVDGLVANPSLKERPVEITNTGGIHKEQLTEHIFALILAWTRRFPRVFAAQKSREWLSVMDADLPVIAGKTMLILGYGSIGEYCARVARSFGMKVVGLRRRSPGLDGDIRIATLDKLPALLGEADFVVNILPFTEDTRNFMDSEEFAEMKESAVYVNVGRGPTTNETALIKALETGQIAGALLDVTSQEPLPGDSPLWAMDNVIITPHYAGMRPDYPALAMEISLENLRRYNKGETLINRIDKNAGY